MGDRWSSRPRYRTRLMLGVGSWLIGLVAYRQALARYFGETPGSGDWIAVLFYSALWQFVLVRFGFWPLFLWLGARITGARQFLQFLLNPILGALVGLLPTLLVARVMVPSDKGLVAPEGLLFVILFACAGAAWGLGYAFLRTGQAGIQ